MASAVEVVCAGIVVADHVCTPIDHLPAAGELVLADRIMLTIGGCAANVAVNLAKMQVAATVVGRVGGDIFGRAVAELLRQSGADTSGLKTSPDSDTSQTLIVNVRGQDRRFIHTFGANADFSAGDIPLDRVMAAKVLYVGGFLIMPSVTQEALTPLFAAARRAGVRTVLDLVTPGPGQYLAQLEKLLPETDVFLPNNHEAELITGQRDPQKQAQLFRSLGAGTVIITMGGEGAILVDDRLKLRVGAYPVPCVDASGGGDAFTAGYICGLLRDQTPHERLRTASALGASCVRAIGTTTGVFTRGECEEFVRKHQLRIETL